MNEQERYEALCEHYSRLRSVAFALLADLEPAGGNEPACRVPPHRVRDLRRELRHERRPMGFFTMSSS